MPRTLHLGDFHPHLEARFAERLTAALVGADARSLLVVVPNRLLAVHLRRRAAELGVGTLGLRPRALEDLIAEWAAPRMAARGLRQLPSWATPWLLSEVLPAPVGAPPARQSDGYFKALAGTVRDLRDGGVSAADLTRALKESGRRPERPARSARSERAAGVGAGDGGPSAAGRERIAEVSTALAAFERALERRRLVDDAGASNLACEALRDGAIQGIGDRSLWLYGFYEMVPRQLAVFDALLAAPSVDGRAVEVFFPWPGGGEAGGVGEYARPLRDALAQRGFAESPSPIATGSPGSVQRPPISALRASSATAEALDLLRVAVAAEIAGETLAIVPRHDEVADEFAFAAARAGRAIHRVAREPLRRSPVGRAAKALLDLAGDTAGLSRAGVEELLVAGGVASERFAERSRPELWTQALRRRGLVGGAAAWNRFLERHAPQASLFTTLEDDEEVIPELSRELPAIASFVAALIADLRPLGQDRKRWAERATRWIEVVEKWLSAGPVRDALVARARELSSLDGVLSPSLRNFRAVLEVALSLPQEAAVRFGDASTLGALASVRGVTFDTVCLPRLVERGFPRVGREDPLLQDADRRWLGKLAEKRAPARAEESFLFQLALGMARRRVVVSWPARGDDGGVVVPSPFLLELASAALGRDATYEDLRAAWSPLASVPDSDRERLLLGSEWDLERIREARLARLAQTARAAAGVEEPSPLGPLSELIAVHPRLAASLAAERARRGERGASGMGGNGGEARLTEYDGLVGADLVAALEGGGPRSPSALEDYARCGFRYLWKRVLRTQGEPPPERRLDLEPREIGGLVHDVLRELFTELRRERLLPLSPTALAPARQRLAPILDRLVEAEPGRLGEGPVALWQARRRQILDDLEDFLEREAVSGEKWKPVDLELAFGEDQPLVIEIGGQALRVRGRIDRIDERPGALRIVDYKTGRLDERKEVPGSLSGGERLQLPLYRLALQRVRDDRRPIHGALLGTTSRSDFRRVEWSPADFDRAAERLTTTVGGIVAGVEAGDFFQVERDRFCDQVCEWTRVCGPSRRRTVAAKRSDPRVVAAAAWREADDGSGGGEP